MWILLTFLAVVLAEIALFVIVGGALGIWLTLAWILLAGAFGIVLLKGVAMLGMNGMNVNIRERMADPASPLAHQALVAIAGGLFLLPGFLTDAIGVLLLIRPIRTLFIRLISRMIKASTDPARSGIVLDGEWRDVTQSSPTDQGDRPS